MSESWLGWDWEALAAIGTFAAVVFALWTSGHEMRIRKRESQARSGRKVHIQRRAYIEYELVSWHIVNNSTATIFGFRYSYLHQDNYGVEIEIEKFDQSHLAPGGIRDIFIHIDNHPENLYLIFMDGNGVNWRASISGQQTTPLGTPLMLERVTPKDDTLRRKLLRFLGSSWATLRGWFSLSNLRTLGGILISLLIAFALFVAGFVTGNGI